jgi:hypothetical protein
MRQTLLTALLLSALLGCASGDKYSTMRPEYGGQVEFPGWPALAQGVVGYNLYLAPKAEGPWEKINEAPIKGGRTLVPYLEPNVEYFFRLTSVSSSGAESKPGAPFKRKASPPVVKVEKK